MKIHQIKWKKITKKVTEDALKKSLELTMLSALIGFQLTKALPTIMAVTGGSLYCKNYQVGVV